MILYNYWRWLGAIQKYAHTSEPGNKNVGLVDTSGNTITLYMDQSGYSSQNAKFDLNLFARIGNSEAAPTESDYSLANDITNSIANLSVNIAYEVNDQLKKTITINGKNGTNNEITITQIGIGKGVKANGGIDKSILVAIAVLNNPVTVPAGNDFTITFEWTEA